MNRTIRAAVLTILVVGLSLAGLGIFLGFPAEGSVGFGVIVGLLSGGLLLAASRRAESFHPTDANAHLTEHRPDAATDTGADVGPGDDAGDTATDGGAGHDEQGGDDDRPQRRPGA